MKLRTLVVDDESAFLGTLQTLLNSRPESLELLDAARSVEEGVAKINQYQPNLVFLDIKLEDGSGFDILRKVDFNAFKVIFITAYDKYAIEAFKFSAVDYLLKPIVSTDLWAAVDRARLEIEREMMNINFNILLENLSELSRDRKKLVLKERDAMHIVRLDSILYCMAEGSYTTFYLDNKEKIMVSQNLKEFEEILHKNGFFRIHRSHLVNIDKIVRYEKHNGGVIHLEGNVALPVAVRKREQLSKLLSKFI